MRNIIVNAPTQNKEFSPDQKIGKVIPMFAADWLRHNDESYSQSGAIDLWNNVLASEQKDHTSASYEAQSLLRISQKYDSLLLSATRIDNTSTILTDSEPEFVSWAQDIITECVTDGSLRLENHDVYVCDACDATIAEATNPCTNGCASCKTMQVHIENRQVLVSVINDQAEQRVDNATDTTHQVHEERRTIVNRRRLNGIGLESIGFKDDVVDPRIGLGMLAIYAAEIRSADQVDVVASRATIRQNLPHFYAAIGDKADELPDLRVRGIAKAPVEHIAYMQEQELLNLGKFQILMRHILPPALLSMKNDMSPQTLERLVFSRKDVGVLHKTK